MDEINNIKLVVGVIKFKNMKSAQINRAKLLRPKITLS